MTSLFLAFALGIGLVVGSFLNVVIHRGPVIWGLVDDPVGRGSLWGPRSECPACRAQIRSWHNIPVISYLWLGGACADCGVIISRRYPLVEITGALIAGAAALVFGMTPMAALAAVFGWGLVALAVIDYETGYLPDAITLPLIITGLSASAVPGWVSPADALIGAVAGYAVFWSVGTIFRAVRGIDGLGLGDAKLLAAIGAWTGWAGLAPVVLAASGLALSAIAVMHLSGRQVGAETEIRFGPALAFAGFVVFLAAVGPDSRWSCRFGAVMVKSSRAWVAGKTINRAA